MKPVEVSWLEGCIQQCDLQ